MIPSIHGKEKREAGMFDLPEYLNVQIEGLEAYCVEAFASAQEETTRYQKQQLLTTGSRKKKHRMQEGRSQ